NIFLQSMVNTLIVGVALIGYEVFMLGRNGTTLGKQIIGIKVVPVGGQLVSNIDMGSALKRALVLFGSYIVNGLSALLGFLSLLVNLVVGVFVLVDVLWPLWDKPLQQALHDKVAKTVVVKTK
ncbi:RDD family protein, partial [Streptosporangium sp. NPDC003464]